MYKLRPFLLAGSVILLSLVASDRRLGAEPEPSQKAPSPDVVRLEVEFLGGAKAKVATPFGEAATVKRSDGSLVEILPERAEDGEIRLQVFSHQPGAAKSARPEEVLQLKNGEAVISKSSGFQIRWSDPGAARSGGVKPVVVSHPLSNLAFRGELVLSSGQSVRFAAREGEVLKVTLAGGRRFGLVPQVKDAATGGASFQVVALEANDRGKAGEKRVPLESLDLTPGAGQTVQALDGAFLRLTQVQDVSAFPPQAPRMSSLSAKASLSEGGSEEIEGGSCCCGVGPDRVCGCMVETDLCFCCIGSCCGIPKY